MFVFPQDENINNSLLGDPPHHYWPCNGPLWATQAVEVKATAHNVIVYMRSARSRHLRSALTEAVNQKAPLCHMELLSNLFDSRLSCSPVFVVVFYFTRSSFTFLTKNAEFIPIR